MVYFVYLVSKSKGDEACDEPGDLACNEHVEILHATREWRAGVQLIREMRGATKEGR